MAVLVIASSPDDLEPSPRADRRRTLIQVSESVRDFIQHRFGNGPVRLTRAAVCDLRKLYEAREFDADLALLIGAVERDGEAYARFL